MHSYNRTEPRAQRAGGMSQLLPYGTASYGTASVASGLYNSSYRKSRMKLLLIICLFLIVTPPLASAQQRTSLTLRQVTEAERHLSDMGYWTGPVDGIFDRATREALIAFQKWHARTVNGRLTRDELEAIRAKADSKAAWPKPKENGYDHVEVDLDRQVLLLVNEKGGIRVLPVSTGTGKPFIEDGQTSIAYTPRGRFVVYDKGIGWETGPLGSVYYANYISGGVAIHGFRSVPTQPASHGCIRIPMFAAREVSKLMKLGTIVLVYDSISFVSAKEWVENPELKEAALLISTLPEYKYEAESKDVVVKKPRPRINRTE